MRYRTLVLVGLTPLLASRALAQNLAPAKSTVTATKVITFRPAAPTGPHQRGNCWTDSIAVDRPGAWRCMVVNSIYDPCFTNPKLKTAVVCDAEPVTNKPGFVLELTKPLPEPRSKRLPDKLPWLLKLADGSTCEVSTGTTAFVNGVTIPYGCSDSQKCNDDGCPYMTGVTEHLKRGKVWIVDKVAFRSTKTGMELLKRETMPVVAVWQ